MVRQGHGEDHLMRFRVPRLMGWEFDGVAEFAPDRRNANSRSRPMRAHDERARRRKLPEEPDSDIVFRSNRRQTWTHKLGLSRARDRALFSKSLRSISPGHCASSGSGEGL